MKCVWNILVALNFVCLNLYALDFSPATTSLENKTFGSFSIGGVNSSVKNPSSDYKDSRNGVVFGLKRGVSLGDFQKSLLNLWIDGFAGRENKNGLYGFSLGGQYGYRMFGGRIVGFLGAGFEMNNLAMPSEAKEQYNIYGACGKVDIFIDMAHGYGISIGYTHGFKHRSKKILNDRFDTSSIMITFSYYDFNI